MFEIFAFFRFCSIFSRRFWFAMMFSTLIFFFFDFRFSIMTKFNANFCKHDISLHDRKFNNVLKFIVCFDENFFRSNAIFRIWFFVHFMINFVRTYKNDFFVHFFNTSIAKVFALFIIVDFDTKFFRNFVSHKFVHSFVVFVEMFMFMLHTFNQISKKSFFVENFNVFLIQYCDEWLQIEMFEHEFFHCFREFCVFKYTIWFVNTFQICKTTKKIIKIVIFCSITNSLINFLCDANCHVYFIFNCFENFIIQTMTYNDCNAKFIENFDIVWKHYRWLLMSIRYWFVYLQ